MKKILVLMTLIAFSISTANAVETNKIPVQKNQQNIAAIKAQRENAFEKKLNLTEEQKLKAREIRYQGHQKIKPVIESIIYKKHEATMVKMSRIAVKDQEERLNKIDEELKVLEKKAHDIRKENMKEFESILTREQKKILKQMKKEGRKKDQAEHPAKKPILQNSVNNK